MTTPVVYVVDASVAAQVVSPEPLTAQATALFALLSGGQAILHVPDLFYIECANIFWKKKQRGVCSESQVVQALAICWPSTRLPPFTKTVAAFGARRLRVGPTTPANSPRGLLA